MRRRRSQAKVGKRKRTTRSRSGQPTARLEPAAIIPGQLMLGTGEILAFQGRETIELTVINVGDRPIQVGSHCHFFEANRALKFDRARAYGFRLQVPAGTAVRFEPGEEKRVTLVALGGHRVTVGINGLAVGRLDDPEVKRRALDAAASQGYTTMEDPR